MKFNKVKGEILHLGQGNPKHRYKMGREWIKNSPEEKDLMILVNETLDMSWGAVAAACRWPNLESRNSKLVKDLNCAAQRHHFPRGQELIQTYGLMVMRIPSPLKIDSRHQI
ncbi:rna-directed dna polymerase from mobile element jockey-like [Pitangus sulphuratus]|nr:rna-directed dna polymerase from mobile element jockey-like [Pitangus sulphuratus]